ncbi:hypothetical protein ACFQVC_20385 [Streptomyces monticola]|uniref:Uncharacterized protein n=1 Tax=Streptomyces monticola TaxID=2666263 RepID=A0ABW2JLJ2_9ACTN
MPGQWAGDCGLPRARNHAGAAPALFVGILAGLRGWLDCRDGEFERAAGHVKDAVRHLETFAHLVAPWLVVDQFLTAARAKARLGACADGARLLGAYDRHAVSGSFGFRPFPDPAELRAVTEAELRAALGTAEYERAYAQGGGLPVREAAALV